MRKRKGEEETMNEEEKRRKHTQIKCTIGNSRWLGLYV